MPSLSPKSSSNLPLDVASLDKATIGLATLFLTSGTTHLVRPQVFEGIVPKLLPNKRELVYVSGVAEIACGLGLLFPQTRKVAGLASAALLVAVFPANVQMSATHAKRAQRRDDVGSKAFFAGTVARLPLQWPLIRTALRAAGRLR
ncbi:putative membrane protein [Knoellia remsis]|uniref:Putative membrane protein n=1 Tax=Knoellia remsis TaxID=407159 RepID=A0A2T0UZL5_9MICO|nr:MauE/DoxX family redox-associated membrane protein [Knoellia remsis]PRY63362.1 putative membrane protein [Knoellia remsis]